MPPKQGPVDTFAALPDPGRAGTLDGLVERLRLLKAWAGDPSYARIRDRVNTAWSAAGRPAGDLARKTTVVDCFRPGRRRLDPDLVVAVVQALHPDAGYVTQWRQALQVISGKSEAAAQVRVQDRLPQEPAGFTGRTAELNRLRAALHHGVVHDGALVIAGMAGVGKTRLAVHAGRRLAGENLVDRVLFVDLRGFHPDPAQPPAAPGAVLDGFLRLLGVPGTRIPHDLPARAAAYRARLAGTRTLVVLDNAADEDQVRPLLPTTPGCPALITSRRSLTGLPDTAHLTVDVFTPDESRDFLTRSVGHLPVGHDPHAPARIARRCGHLPLALGLVAAHIRATPRWTLTEHADRLDERGNLRRLDSGVELALDLSYQHLPSDRQRLLRLAALHPGQDLAAHAAAALADSDLPTVRSHLNHLYRDHLLQQGTPGRYGFHDLVRAYATGRAGDEDPPSERRAALTRLFDFYLATAALAMNTLYPAEAHRRPEILPSGTPCPNLADPDTALAWLNTERPTVVAVAAHTATHGWPAHTTRLSTTLFRYFNGGHHSDAVTVHGYAADAARHTGDPAARAHALTDLGAAHLWLGRYGPAVDHLQQALHLFRRAGNAVGEARVLNNLGSIEVRLGRHRRAVDHYERALTLSRQAGDRVREARTLGNLGAAEVPLGHLGSAVEHLQQALTLSRRADDRIGIADALSDLGDANVRMGRYETAGEYLQQALTLYRQLGDRDGEADVLDGLGALHTRLGQPAQAIEHHRRSLAICREIGDRDSETWALNGLGEAATAAGHPADALTHHTAAHTTAAGIGNRYQLARAHAGLGHAHLALDHYAPARRHFQHALTLYSDLGMPEANRIRAHLHRSATAPDRTGPPASTPDDRWR